jgi:transcription antitermination factor NusG
MPLLSVRSGVVAWPPELPDNLPAGPWTVAHVKPRQDTRLADDCRRFGIPSLVFVEYRLRVYGHGPQRSQVPMFPGYVFVPVDRERHLTLYETGRTVRLMMPPGDGEMGGDLRDLVSMVRRSIGPVLVRPELVVGTTVRIRRGCLAGCQGVVVRRQGQDRLVVNLPLLGHSVETVIPAESVVQAVG